MSEKVARDNCQICNGNRGGVPGNENRLEGYVMCDHCHADALSNVGFTFFKTMAERDKELATAKERIAALQGDGTPMARLDHLLDELSQRFAIEHLAARGPEIQFIEAIDAQKERIGKLETELAGWKSSSGAKIHYD